MSNDWLLGIFITVSGVGWATLFGLIAWVGNNIWKAIEGLRADLLKMVSREEFERRHTELGTRIDHAHRRIDDIWSDRTDPGLGGKR